MLSVVLIAGWAASQTPVVGTTWRATQPPITMVLAPDGTFTLEMAGGKSSGLYQIQGQMLLMQDGATGSRFLYQATQPAPGILMLTDATGARIEFNAAGAGTAAEGKAQAAGPVLAEAKGLVLREGDLKPAFEMVELVIDARLTDQERRRLVRSAIEEFPQDPQEFMRQIRQIGDAMQRLATITDPFQLGLARQTLYGSFFLATQSLPPDQVPELVKVMREHLRVVAVDPAAQLVLTSRDIDAMLAYDRFVASLTGQAPLGLASLPRQGIEAQLAGQFSALPLQVKQTLVAMYPVWQATQYAWSRMTPQQQQMVAMQLRQQLLEQQAAQVPGVYGGSAGSTMSGGGQVSTPTSRSMALEAMRSANSARIFSSLLDTTAGFTPCYVCSPGVNPFK